MENICDWKNCKEKGEFRAPIEKDNSKRFRLLCKNHIKKFNQDWDYFKGMNQDEIEDRKTISFILAGIGILGIVYIVYQRRVE